MDRKKKKSLKLLCDLMIIVCIIVALIASFSHLEIAVSLMSATFIYSLYLFINLLNFKLKTIHFPFMFITAVIVFLILHDYLPFFEAYLEYGVLFFEILFVILLWITLSLKKRIRNGFIRRNKLKDLYTSIFLDEFFQTFKICRYIFTIHLIVVFIYQFGFVAYQTPGLTRFLFSRLNLVLIFAITVYEYIHIFVLRTEKWLPIVSENGNVVGKIAYSVSISSKKQYLHPIVRIALTHNNLLFLSKADSDNKIESDKLDFPFENFVKYGHTLDETVNQILQEEAGLKNLSGKFVFKHICKKTSMHRLIHVYVVQIPNHQQVKTTNSKSGKWWTEKHIEENLHKGIFSECFEMEYEVLKNTILLANRMINRSSEEKNE